MAFQTLNFSNKMSSRISLEIKFWITFNTGPETRNFQGASAQIQLAQKGSIFPKKSLIFISKMAILGSFRGGSEVAFVTSVFFALSSVTYWTIPRVVDNDVELHPILRSICSGGPICFQRKVSKISGNKWPLETFFLVRVTKKGQGSL